jgi:hypothetical protein
MKLTRWIVTAAAAALTLLAAPAEAALCVKRSGAVVARAACKAKETVLNPDVFSGSPGPAGEPGEKGDKGDPAGFSVVDGNGETIGHVDAYSYMPVRVPSVGILSFRLGPKGFEPYNYNPYLYHEGANCVGPAFVTRSEDDGFVQYPAVFNSIAYYAGNPVAEHTFNSYEYPTPTCTTGLTPRGFCCENYSSPYTYDAGPVQTLDVTSFGTPPFGLEQ